MTNRITLRAPLIRFILLTAFACFSWQSYSQCTTAGFGSYAGFSVDNSGALQTWATDLWTDELSPGFGFIPGDEYEFSVTLNSDGTHKYITLVDSGGIVIASGLSPLTAIITDTDIEVYRHDDDGSGGCLGSTSFHTGTVQNLDAEPDPAPGNDLCVDATPISCGDTISGTNVSATDGDGVAGDGCGTSSTAVGVWYAFMGTGDTVTASTCNPATDFDTEVTVYEGVCGDFACVGNNDDDSSCEGSFESFGSPRTSTFTWESMVGTTYYIYVSGFGSNTGNFDLSLTCEAPPACVPPTIDSATIVDNCDVDGTFSVDVVVSDAGDAGTVISDGTDTYPVVVGTITVGPFNSGDNITLTVDATDDACDSSLGDFTVTCPPPGPDNDDCANATAIACGDTISGTNIGATDAGGVAGSCSISTNAVGVWYAFMGTGDVVTASVCNAADFDTEITVFTGVCDDLSCLANNDDNFGAGCSGNTSELEFESMVGTTYYIYVSGFSSNVGTFDLSLTCEEPVLPPDNDECEAATPIACGDTVMDTTENATNSGGSSGPDVFYSLDDAGAGDEVTVSLCGSSFDTVLTVLDACDGNTVASNDDNFGVCGNTNSHLTFIADGSTTYYIRVDGFGSTSSGDYTLSITCEQPDPCEGGTTHEWTGTSGSSWMNAGNWLNGDAPGLMLINADVTIPAGAANYPELMSGQELHVDECSTLTVDVQATLTFNPNAVITNDGTVTNNGMTTFESDESGTAYVGSGTGMFNGDFTVERFIPAKRAYRQLSPAVSTSTPISDNWQQDTHITGPAGNTDGFDVTQTGNPSMYIFDNVAYDYVEVANTNATNLMPGTMYHILIRGDRTTDLTNNNATPSDTTLKTTGELTADNNGSQMISVNVPEQRFIAVGNPFQAQVDMNEVLTTDAMNISPNFYWVWDPTLGFRGAYTAIVASTGVASSGDSDADQYLQAGQAGWVYTAGAGMSSVNFTQSSKNTGVETDVFRNASNANSLGQLRLSLYESTALSNNESAADGVLIMFDSNGSNDVDANDAPNITNLDENFAINNGGVLLSIENRAAPQDQEEIQLEINTYRNTNYTIVAEGISMEGATAFLLDTYTNVMTEIPQTGSVNYSYTVNTGLPGTIAGERFKIVFTTSTLSVDTLDLGSIKLYPNPTKTGKFNINVPLGMDDLEVTIYSMLGVRLYNETGFNPGQRITIDAKRVLSAGTYLVELSSNGKTATKKLIIN